MLTNGYSRAFDFLCTYADETTIRVGASVRWLRIHAWLKFLDGLDLLELRNRAPAWLLAPTGYRRRAR